jgi:hypothetical protein
MSTAARLVGYGAALAALLVGGYAVGSSTHLGDVSPVQHTEHEEMSAPATAPGGVEVTRDGYTLALPATGYRPGRADLRFRVLGPDGRSVTRYERSHDKDLHLIAVRRDFRGFQHVHPQLDVATGTWSVPLDLTPGAWRVLADFVPRGGEPLTLGADLLVPGETLPTALPAPTRTTAVDGYDVTAAGDLVAGKHVVLDLAVSKAGRPADLEPYLGAYGHLVALREGDLAYLHVHPEGRAYSVEVPSAGRYHLFLDFKAGGAVHTAALTLDAGRPSR